MGNGWKQSREENVKVHKCGRAQRNQTTIQPAQNQLQLNLHGFLYISFKEKKIT